jgi:hypothetical protein
MEGGQAELILTEVHRAQPILGVANLSWVVGGDPRAGLLFWIHGSLPGTDHGTLDEQPKEKSAKFAS